MNTTTKAIIVISGLLLIIYFFFKGLGDALTPLIISFTLAYLLFPIINKFEKSGIDRKISILVVTSAIVIILSGTLYFIIPKVYQDSKDFITELPKNTTTLLNKVEVMTKKLDLDIDLSKESLKEMIEDNISGISSGLVKSFSNSFKSISSNLIEIILGILNFFLIPLFFYYVITDYEKLTNNIKNLVPKSIKPKLKKYIKLTNEVLSGFIRGQLLVALSLGVFYGIGLPVIGLKFGILIGFFGGLLCIIPYVGASIVFIGALTMAFATNLNTMNIIYICILFFAGQIIEGNFITPKLVGSRVGISAFLSVLALIIGGNLLGLIGMIIAIPTAAIIKSIFKELIQEYESLNI